MGRPKLNRKLRLERGIEAADGAGGKSLTWVEQGVLWAEIVVRTGRDQAVAGGLVSRIAYRITTRASAIGSPSRPLAGDRFRDGSRVFRIEAVAEADAQARYLVCFAETEGQQ